MAVNVWRGLGPVLILGSGGHATVLQEAFRGRGIHAAMVNHHTEAFDICGDQYLTLGMGRRSIRRQVADAFPKGPWASVVHYSAAVSPSAQIGEGAQIMAGAIVQANAIIGKHAIINTGAQVDHGCKIGDFAHICPGAVLCADVTVWDGAMVEPGQVVRRGCMVGHPFCVPYIPPDAEPGGITWVDK